MAHQLRRPRGRLRAGIWNGSATPLAPWRVAARSSSAHGRTDHATPSAPSRNPVAAAAIAAQGIVAAAATTIGVFRSSAPESPRPATQTTRRSPDPSALSARQSPDPTESTPAGRHWRCRAQRPARRASATTVAERSRERAGRVGVTPASADSSRTRLRRRGPAGTGTRGYDARDRPQRLKEDSLVARAYLHPVNKKLVEDAPLGARVADRVTGFMGRLDVHHCPDRGRRDLAHGEPLSPE